MFQKLGNVTVTVHGVIARGQLDKSISCVNSNGYLRSHEKAAFSQYRKRAFDSRGIVLRVLKLRFMSLRVSV